MVKLTKKGRIAISSFFRFPEESFIGNKFEWQLKPAKGLYFLKNKNEKGEMEQVMVEFN